MSKKKEDKIIMRHILEVRLKKRIFSFMDFRGRMVEYMIDALGTDQIKLQSTGSRFDVADNKLENMYFFSIENFGFQSELSNSFKDFSGTVKKLFDSLRKFTEYKADEGFVRIGTKSVILYHRRGDNVQDIKDAYRDLLINNYSQLSKLTASEIVDTAYTFDLKLKNSKARVLTGPVTKKEALEKFFQGEIKDKYGERFDRDSGMILSIDLAGDTPSSIKDLDALEKQVNIQIEEVNSVFKGFKDLFAREG